MSKIILYIEDDPFSQRLIYRFLKKTDYIIHAVSSGASGIATACEVQPDLILLDINLPDMDGFEVCLKMRQIEHLANIPIVAITANNMGGDRQLVLQSGFDDYVAKPIIGIELMNCVQRWLVKKNTAAD